MSDAGGNVMGSGVNVAGNMVMMHQQLENQRKLNKEAYDMNQRSMRESPTAQVAGLEAAGVNPATMAGNFQAAPEIAPGAAASGQFTMSNIFEGLADIIAAAKAPSEISNTKADTNLKKKQALLTKEQREKIIKETQLTDQQLDQILDKNWAAVSEYKQKYPDKWEKYVEVTEGETKKQKEENAWQKATIGLMEGKAEFHEMLGDMAVKKYQGMLAESMNNKDYIDAVKKLTTEQAKIMESQAKTVQRQFEQLDWLTGYGKVETSAYAREKTAEVHKLEDEAEQWANKLKAELDKLKEEAGKLKTSSAKDISDIINDSIGTGLKAVETALRAKGLSTIADKLKKLGEETNKSSGKKKGASSSKKPKKKGDDEIDTDELINNAGGLGMRRYLNFGNYG